VAGVKGNLVAKWEGKAKYELKLEPIDQRQQEGFAAVAADPPHPITLSVRLKDASNNVVCSKNILFQLASPKADSTLADKSAAPAALPVGTNPPQAAATSPQPPPSLNIDASDSVQSEIGSDGQIAALHAQGDLPCSKQLYQRIYYWDFSTDFPTVAEQEELLKGHKLVAAKAERKEQPADKSSAPTRAGGMKSLPTPIEGDDVITGFSPARGVAETRSGRVFLIGSGGLQDRGTGWQVFPASIHYRCDKKAACIITRNGASATMHARLKQ
jgi:hypothetical protein